MDGAMVWEERAPTTGTIHRHGVFILKYAKRMRPEQFKQWFVQKLPSAPQPHVEACKNKIAAIRYSSMASKDEAWVKYMGESGRDPAFFVSIHWGCYKMASEVGELELILLASYKLQNLTKRL